MTLGKTNTKPRNKKVETSLPSVSASQFTLGIAGLCICLISLLSISGRSQETGYANVSKIQFYQDKTFVSIDDTCKITLNNWNKLKNPADKILMAQRIYNSSLEIKKFLEAHCQKNK